MVDSRTSGDPDALPRRQMDAAVPSSPGATRCSATPRSHREPITGGCLRAGAVRHSWERGVLAVPGQQLAALAIRIGAQAQEIREE
jgi:hypothetical protein